MLDSIHIRTDGWLSKANNEPDELVQILGSCSVLALLSFYDFKGLSNVSDDLQNLIYIEPLYNTVVKALDDCFDFKNSNGDPIMALNSIRLIIDIIHPIIYHSQARDESLVMSNGPSIDNRSCYLLGKRVYSTASKKQFSQLKKRYRNLVESIIRPLTTAFGPEPWMQMPSEKIIPALTACFRLDVTGAPFHIFEATFHPFVDLNRNNPVMYKRVLHKAHTLDHNSILPLALSKGTSVLLENAIKRLQQELESVLLSHYPGCQLTVYGSCLSNLSLTAVSDVDISLSVPLLTQAKASLNQKKMTGEKYFSHLKKVMFTIQSLFARNTQLADINVISKARVPLIKGRVLNVGNPLTADGSISFDLCFLNDIAVANSSLLREYSLIDERVKYLMLVVKLWAKRNDIASAAHKTISSYAWMNLVIFYLQCIEFIPNLQSPSLMRAHGFTPSPNHVIDEMNTAFLTSSLIKQQQLWTIPSTFETTPVSLLLYGFFSFYASYLPDYLITISIREGRCALTKFSFKSSNLWRFSIEDPFETHDSHRPHDLGIQLSANGQQKIALAFQNSAKKLRQFLLGDETGIDIFDSVKKIASHRKVQSTKPATAKSDKKNDIPADNDSDKKNEPVPADNGSRKGGRGQRKNRKDRRKQKERTELGEARNTTGAGLKSSQSKLDENNRLPSIVDGQERA